MTLGTLHLLREGVRSGGRCALHKTESRLRALVARGYATAEGLVTDAGREALLKDQRQTLPCILCGMGVLVEYTIPIGDELCEGCHETRTGATSSRKRGPMAQDYHFHGKDRDIDT